MYGTQERRGGAGRGGAGRGEWREFPSWGIGRNGGGDVCTVRLIEKSADVQRSSKLYCMYCAKNLERG